MGEKYISRRKFGSSAAFISSAAVASSLTSCGNAQIKTLPSDPKDQLIAMVKMMGTMAEERVVWKTKGKIFAILPDDVILLYGMRGSESTWWKQIDFSQLSTAENTSKNERSLPQRAITII